MSNVLYSSKLINSIKRRAMLPSGQNTFKDNDFLDMLNEEIQYFAIPHLMSVHEEYLMTHEDIPLVSGQTEYSIPYRAIGNKLRDVAYVTNVDSQNNSGNYYELSRISVEDLSDYNTTNTSSTNLFYIKDNKVVLIDEYPYTDSVLRMFFYLRPNTLVLEKYVATISSIDTVSGIVTVSNFPESFSSLPKMDFVAANTPNKIYSYDITPTSVNSNTKSITFSADDIPGDLIVGDQVTVACQASVPQLPTELHPVLCQRVAVAALEALGDLEGYSIASKRLEQMEQATLNILDNRVEGAPQKLNNRHSPLNQTLSGGHRNKRRL